MPNQYGCAGVNSPFGTVGVQGYKGQKMQEIEIEVVVGDERSVDDIALSCHEAQQRSVTSCRSTILKKWFDSSQTCKSHTCPNQKSHPLCGFVIRECETEAREGVALGLSPGLEDFAWKVQGEFC